MTSWYPGPAVCFDFDGTLTDGDAFPACDAPPAKDMTDLARVLHAEGYTVLVTSARRATDHHLIDAWLRTNNVPFDALYCGLKPPADFYIDDRAPHTIPRVLHALLEWRLRGTDTWMRDLAAGMSHTDVAVNAAAPQGADPGDFRVIIPVTGGVDSTTLWAMAREAGLPYQCLYMRLGQNYADTELDVLARLMPDEHIEIIDPGPLPFRVDGWTLACRNAAIILLAAAWASATGVWGEVWFGNTQGEGPIVGGDKSHRFLNDMQHLLTVNAHDLRLCSPVAGWEKDDTVRWWLTREPDLATLRATRSCFEATGECGACVACFRRATAFILAGLPPEQVESWWPAGFAFDPIIARYRERMEGDAWQRHGYSPHRTRLTLHACDLLEGTCSPSARGSTSPPPTS